MVYTPTDGHPSMHVLTRQRMTGSRTRDLLITSPTPYSYVLHYQVTYQV